jgi:hypothetical protein
MTGYIVRGIPIAIAVLALTAGARSTAYSQSNHTSEKEKDETVLVVGIADLAADISSRVTVTVDGSPVAVIVVRKSASPGELAAAFGLMDALRKEARRKNFRAGAMLRQELKTSATPRKLSAEEADAYARYLGAIKASPDVDVPGFGRGGIVQVVAPKWK